MRISKIPDMVGSQILILAVGLALMVGAAAGGVTTYIIAAPKAAPVSTTTTSIPAKVEATTSAAVKTEPAEKPGCESRTHPIVKGDALEKISVKYYGKRTFVNFLAKENNIANEDLIFAGNTLTIPCNTETEATAKPTSGTRTSATSVAASNEAKSVSTMVTEEVPQHALLQLRNVTQVEFPEPPLHIIRQVNFVFPAVTTKRS
jgi:LysM repeat protein